MTKKSTARETVVAPCAHCDAKVSATVQGEYVEYAEEAGFNVRWALLRCPACTRPIVVAQDDEDAMFGGGSRGASRWAATEVLYPSDATRSLGGAVPALIRTAFVEARACFKVKAFTACAIMCRKVLEGICDTHSAKGNNLAARLKYLADKGVLDQRLYAWITAVRITGNEAAHDVQATVSKEDASDMLDLAEGVAEYLYTFKEKFEAFEARRKNRKKDGDSAS